MTLERLLRNTALVCVFVLPFLALYVSSSLFFPFISGKNFAFRILVEIAAASWLALAILNPVYRPRRTWLLWGFAAFVAIIGVADVFGVYPFKSFWSNYERMEGWVTIAHLFTYFVVAVSILNTEKLWRAWWYTTLGVSAIVGCIGLFQLFGWVTINQSGSRLDARLGNSTYAGVYMLFHIFMAAFFLARTWVQEPQNRGVAAWLLGPLIALNSLILFFTATRGAILGLIGGAVFSALLLSVVASVRVRRASVIGIAGLVILAGAFWTVKDAAWVHEIEPLHRLATLFDGTVSSRFMNWEMAWQGAKERPILGWGQENYAAVFDKYYNPAMYAQEPWFDRTHNIIFDWLIAGGFLGLIAYLSLYLFALLMIWRSGAFAPYERAILSGLLAGYFFYLLFTFDNITSYILFASLLAYIAVRAGQDGTPIFGTRAAAQTMGPVLAGAAIVLAGGLVWFVNADAIRQNRALINAIQPQAGGIERNLEYFLTAESFRSVGTQEVREQFSQAAISVMGADVPVELKQRFVQSGAEAMERQVKDSLRSARAPFFLGILFDHAGVYAEGKQWLEVALERSPRKQAILFELGLNAYARNAPEEALGYFKQAYESAPEYREARMYYVGALIRTGNDAEAERILQQDIDAGTAVDQRLASAYASRNRYDKIAQVWTAHIAAHPQDLDARLMLAGAYYAAGNSAAAIRALEDAKDAIPSAAAQADELIQQVRSGAPVQ